MNFQNDALLVLQILAFSRGRLLFLLNFHSEHSHDTLQIPVEEAGQYEVSSKWMAKIVL